MCSFDNDRALGGRAGAHNEVGNFSPPGVEDVERARGIGLLRQDEICAFEDSAIQEAKHAVAKPPDQAVLACLQRGALNLAYPQLRAIPVPGR